MGGLDAQIVKYPDRVVGQVFQLVCRLRVAAERCGHVGKAGVLHPGGQAAVPVVEADEVESPRGELGAEVGSPADHLRAKARDQERRPVAGRPECLVLELDPVRLGPGHHVIVLRVEEVAGTLPLRADVEKRFTWHSESVFPDEGGWEQAVETITARLPDLAEFRGHLGDSPDNLADWFDASERLQRLMGKVTVYSTMAYSVDTGNEASFARTDRARTVAAQLGAATSFALPEMIAIGFPKLREWVAGSARLAHLTHYFDRVEKLQKRIRSAEVEEVLTQASDPLATALSVHGVMANTDLRFPPAVASDGAEHEVAQGTIAALLTSTDRDLRRTAFESYADEHLAMQNSMAGSLAGGVKRDIFYARARGFTSSLAASLEPNHIPAEVYRNILQAFRDNVGTWHRYWRIRRKALGLDPLKPYDTRAHAGLAPLHVSSEPSGAVIAEGA